MSKPTPRALTLRLPGFILLLCLAWTLGVLALRGGTAEAKPRRGTKGSHHVRRHRPRHRHRLRHRAHHARRRTLHARRARRLTAERRGRDRVVRAAWHAVGVPYRWGGTSPRSGFDCSGLVRWVYGHVGISLPHYSVAQWSYGRRVPGRALLPGDVLFFSGLGHVGIYIGRGAFIDAPHTGARVRLEHLNGWYASSFVGARRFQLG
jgi:cell wall-associated NlpC family hydrolase